MRLDCGWAALTEIQRRATSSVAATARHASRPASCGRVVLSSNGFPWGHAASGTRTQREPGQLNSHSTLKPVARSRAGARPSVTGFVRVAHWDTITGCTPTARATALVAPRPISVRYARRSHEGLDMPHVSPWLHDAPAIGQFH